MLTNSHIGLIVFQYIFDIRIFFIFFSTGKLLNGQSLNTSESKITSQRKYIETYSIHKKTIKDVVKNDRNFHGKNEFVFIRIRIAIAT